MSVEQVANRPLTSANTYEIGISRIKEGVISSHFMHKLAQNVRASLYDDNEYVAKCLVIDEATVAGRLIPLLRSASEEYCRRRVEAARRRARAKFRDYGYVCADQVGSSECMVEAIVDREFSRTADRDNDRKFLNEQLKSQIRALRPIQMVIPALPFKISSPLKARGILPDLGEANFLLSLYEIAKVVEGFYVEAVPEGMPPLVTFTIVSDGLRFNEALNKPENEVRIYQEALATWVQILGLGAYIQIVDYKDLLLERFTSEEKEAKARLRLISYTAYSNVMWPVFDPTNAQGSLEAAAQVELDPEITNPQGRFVSLLKSLVFTLDYKALRGIKVASESMRAKLYHELTANIFRPYVCSAGSGVFDVPLVPHKSELFRSDTREQMEGLRRSMLREVWEAAICYISEIKSDRDQKHDPILKCLPEHLRWTIHRKPGQIALSNPPILGMAAQPWAGSAVFRPAGNGRIRLCTLPALLLEGSQAVPVVGATNDQAHRQPLFYIDSEMGIGSVEDLLEALSSSFTRQRFS